MPRVIATSAAGWSFLDHFDLETDYSAGCSSRVQTTASHLRLTLRAASDCASGGGPLYWTPYYDVPAAYQAGDLRVSCDAEIVTLTDDGAHSWASYGAVLVPADDGTDDRYYFGLYDDGGTPSVAVWSGVYPGAFALVTTPEAIGGWAAALRITRTAGGAIVYEYSEDDGATWATHASRSGTPDADMEIARLTLSAITQGHTPTTSAYTLIGTSDVISATTEI